MVTPQYERIVGGATTSVTLISLEPGTTYRIRVWSTDGTSVSSEAMEIDATTVESGERCHEHVHIRNYAYKRCRKLLLKGVCPYPQCRNMLVTAYILSISSS